MHVPKPMVMSPATVPQHVLEDIRHAASPPILLRPVLLALVAKRTSATARDSVSDIRDSGSRSRSGGGPFGKTIKPCLAPSSCSSREHSCYAYTTAGEASVS